MLVAIAAALEVNRVRVQATPWAEILRKCYETLTPRERGVMGLVCGGSLNGEVTAALSLSKITVKFQVGESG